MTENPVFGDADRQRTASPRAFISYSHSQGNEVALAEHLRDGLARAGYYVFIDTGILVGTDWVLEIERQIMACDFLIILLSKAAMASEMVQGELRLAAKSREQRCGLPHLLPVRVRYFGALDYELDSRLSRIQYSRWESDADSDRILNELIIATRGGNLPEHVTDGSQPPRETLPRPLPRIDPRSLAVEGGALPSDEPLYIARDADAAAVDLAKRPGRTLVIKAAKQMGKSSLLVRYLSECQRQEPPKRIAFTDLSVLSQDDLATYPIFLTQLADTLRHALELSAEQPAVIQNQMQMTWFVEDHLLKPTAGRVVFAFDTVDRILGRSYQAKPTSLPCFECGTTTER